MNIDLQTLQVKNNPAENRFEVQLGDTIGEIVYRKKGSTYIMDHTGVPMEYRGQGIANYLVHEALEQVKAENAMIVPLCSFVRVYIQRHPEYQALVTHIPHDR